MALAGEDGLMLRWLKRLLTPAESPGLRSGNGPAPPPTKRDAARAEVERLRALVRRAYWEGWNSGYAAGDEHDGTETADWAGSNASAALRGEEVQP